MAQHGAVLVDLDFGTDVVSSRVEDAQVDLGYRDIPAAALRVVPVEPKVVY